MDNIILTLGHNSSAILVRDGNIIAGYENERFSMLKSDSAFPQACIDALIANHGPIISPDIFIGHWFLDGQLPEKSNKYLNYEYLNSVFPGSQIHSLSREFTHHDSHLLSAQVFAGQFENVYHALVMDGFGTQGECMSVYVVGPDGGYQLKQRVFGFSNSLGMLYQYATAYMGMKQHNHEYKILAYEVCIDDADLYNAIRQYASNKAAERFSNIMSGNVDTATDPVISLTALPEVQLKISEELDEFCDEFEIDKTNELEFRSAVSLYVQTVVEQVVKGFVGFYQIKNVLLAGGLFYNVKLNNLISKWVAGKTCVMPLAGDQGAGLGVYQYYRGDLKWPDHLYWGTRNLDFETEVRDIEVFDNFESALDTIYGEISRIGFVNIVRGAMEFGPRALCNTSTLALPLKRVCDVINKINDRTSEMPMAPVCTPEKAFDMFKHMDKIHKSLHYMIVTRDYNDSVDHSDYDGIMHNYPFLGVSTGRPQIVDESDPDMLTLLDMCGGVLINTSFNYHGVPIVYDKESIEHTHLQQQAKDPSLGIKTIIIKG